MFRPTQVIDPKASSKKKMSEENQNIQVFVRCRPLNSHEKRGHVEVISEKKAIKISQQNKAYSFDNVFDTKAKQFQVYQSVVEPLVDQVIEGYNCTVFAYGQTGTGKTFTMVGNRTDKQVSWEEDPACGIIPRAIDQLIDNLENQDAEYTIRVSFLELYNEDAYDLLSPLSDANKLRIYNDTERKGSVIISGLVEMIVKTKNEIFDILEKGSLKRQTAPTLMNACSSRSHSIFSVTVHIKEVTLDGEEVVKLGKLNLVDLAGSENIGRSGAVEERAREASNINKSLLTLGRVITSLVEKSPHIPYRDSKLTRLLQDSLGGKTKTSIIATISPSLEDLEDTISTLDYAQRAKKITNKPEINLKMSKKTLITEYLAEINRLQRDLEASRDKKGVYVDSKNFASMETRIKEQEQSLEVKEARIEFLQEELNKCSIILSETEESLKSRCQELEFTKSNLDQVSTKLCFTEENLENVQMEVIEHKVLVDAHQNAEKKLLNEAKSVLEIADKCTYDNEHLFKKIHSFSLLENTNSLVLKQFMDSFTHEIIQINNFNLCIFNSINKGNKSITKLAENNRSTFLQRESELRKNMTQMETNFDQFNNDLLELVGKEQDTITLTNNLKLIMNNFKSQMAAHIEEGLSSFSNNESQTASKLDDLVSESLRTRTQIEEMIMMQISRINATSKNTISTVLSIKDDLIENYKDKCLENDKLRKEISELRAIIDNIKVEEQLKQLTQSINKITEEYQQKLGQIGHSLNNIDILADSFSNNDSKFKNQLSMKTDDFIQYCKDDDKEVSQVLSKFDDCNNQRCQNLIDKCIEIKKVRSQFECERVSFDNEALSHIDNSMVSIHEIINNVDNKIIQSMKIKENCLENFKDKFDTFSQSSNEIVEALFTEVDNSAEATLEEYKTMQSDCETFNSSQQIRINECCKIAESLYNKGYQTYEVTGLTPKKCSYSYPRNFTITSPHERIIARFKANIETRSTSKKISIENSSSSNTDLEFDSVDENEENKNSICNGTFSVVESKLNVATSKQITKNNRKLLREKN